MQVIWQYLGGLSDFEISFVSIGVLSVSLACLAFIIDAFRRLSKCLEHDKVGISKF